MYIYMYIYIYIYIYQLFILKLIRYEVIYGRYTPANTRPQTLSLSFYIYIYIYIYICTI